MLNLILAAAALSGSTVPAAQTNAAFVGPRVEAQIGLTNDDNVSYTGTVGGDVGVGDRLTLGADVTTTDVFENDRSVGAGVRAGVAVHPNALVFGRVGYKNVNVSHGSNLDGVEFGGGLNLRIAPNLYTSVEYRRAHLDHGVRSDAGLLGLGFRF